MPKLVMPQNLQILSKECKMLCLICLFVMQWLRY